MRTALRHVGLVFLLLAVSSKAFAQGTSVTFITLQDDAENTSDATYLGIGLRRGLGSHEGLDFNHPVDLLATGEEPPVELFDARDALDGIAELIRNSDAVSARDQLQSVVAIFEGNLLHVSRRELVDAHMLLALTSCVEGNEAVCAEGFRRVITYRENLEYNTDRYPEDFLPLFEDTKQAHLNSPRADFEVHTSPPGVEVFVDGRSYGASPAVVGGVLTGEHYVTTKTLGLQRTVHLVVAVPGEVQQVTIELQRERQYRLVEDNLSGIRGELGQSRAGQAIQGVSGYLPSNQVVFAVVGRSGGRVEVSLYLYDLRTRFLLNRVDFEVPASRVEDRTELAAVELYEGVDLEGRVEAPDDDDEGINVFEQWWFWAGAGVLVIAAGVTAGVLLSLGSDCPDGHQCGTISLVQ